MVSCDSNLNPKENRIYIIYERKLDENNTFYWFKGSGQIMHSGISYFQITDDRCKLSIKGAIGYCKEPIQIYEIKNDSIFVLAMSEIITVNKHERFKIINVPYNIELYDANKKPDIAKQYFLDSLCKK